MRILSFFCCLCESAPHIFVLSFCWPSCFPGFCRNAPCAARGPPTSAPSTRSRYVWGGVVVKTTNKGWGVTSLRYSYVSFFNVPLSVEHVGPFDPHISPYEVVHVCGQLLVRQAGSGRVWVARPNPGGFETLTIPPGPVERLWLNANGLSCIFVQSGLWAGMISLQVRCGFRVKLSSLVYVREL